MKIRSRFIALLLIACAAMVFLGGCERTENASTTSEVDDADYRHAKELLRQGRDQEALTEFQKVIERRGLNNAPESHLELGLLYQNHIRDPIAAIYHYRRYRELKPNSPQSELVRQRIDAATREFARTLPAQPLDNLERFDMTDVVQRLQRENEQLKGENARLKGAVIERKRAETPNFTATDGSVTETSGPAQGETTESSPIARAPVEDDSTTETAVALTPPEQTRNPINSPAHAAPAAAAPAPKPTASTSSGVRRHVIVKGDTLYSLAQRYYGSRSKWRDILEANRDILKSKDDSLRLGMEIKIPQ